MLEPKEIRTRSKPACYLCGAGGFLMYQDLQDKLYDVPGTWNVRKCTNASCGLIWLDPVPEEEEMGRLYEAYYTHAEKAADTPAKSSASPFSNIAGMASIATALINQKNLLKHRRASRKIYDRLSTGENILEVGCGKGDFLHYMRGKGKQVSGVDTDGKACEYARQKYDLNIFHGTLEAAGFPDDSFDTVMLNHVIEHIADPVAILTECRRVLQPGGNLALITPDPESLGHRIFRENWLGLEAPRHLHLFSRVTLRTLVQKARFSDVETFNASGHDFFFYLASWKIKNRNGGKKYVGHKSGAVNAAQAALLRYYGLMAAGKDTDFGEELVLQCRKR